MADACRAEAKAEVNGGSAELWWIRARLHVGFDQ